MTKICTTIEQSKKLIELGIDTETADMYWELEINAPKLAIGNYILHNQCREDKDYKKLTNPVISPAWSLSKLLELMPKCFSEKADEYSSYFWSLEWQLGNDKSIRYIALGGNRRIRVEFYERSYERKDEIDIAVEMVCWLLENKKL